MRKIVTTTAALFATLGFATSAQAHNSSASVANCAQTVVSFSQFATSGSGNGGVNTVHFTITKNGTTVTDQTASFTGAGTSVTVPNPLNKGDVVRVRTRWFSSETRDGHSKPDAEIYSFTAVNCAELPPPVIPPIPPVPPVPPTPPVPPVPLTPPLPPVPPVPCVELDSDDYFIGFTVKRKKVIIEVVGPKAIKQRFLDGKKVGRKVSRKRFEKSNVVVVNIKSNPGCTELRIDRRIPPLVPPGPPVFTG